MGQKLDKGWDTHIDNQHPLFFISSSEWMSPIKSQNYKLYETCGFPKSRGPGGGRTNHLVLDISKFKSSQKIQRVLWDSQNI